MPHTAIGEMSSIVGHSYSVLEEMMTIDLESIIADKEKPNAAIVPVQMPIEVAHVSHSSGEFFAPGATGCG